MADKEIHARLVIHDLSNMPEGERKRVAGWLRNRADEVLNPDPAGYAPKYTSRIFKLGEGITVRDYTPNKHKCASKAGNRCDVCFEELPK